jgi:hypothetical protein
MKWLRILPVLALAVGLTAISGPSTAQERKGHSIEHQQKYHDCAKACDDCARMCDFCTSHCAHMVADGKKEHLPTLQSCQDCAVVCNAAASITARLGPYADAICSACADVCKRCAEACNKHRDDATMKKCADECRKCEQACREMLKHTGHGVERR